MISRTGLVRNYFIFSLLLLCSSHLVENRFFCTLEILNNHTIFSLYFLLFFLLNLLHSHIYDLIFYYLFSLVQVFRLYLFKFLYSFRISNNSHVSPHFYTISRYLSDTLNLIFPQAFFL